MLSLVGIIVGLALLIFLAFRGKSLLWAAPVCALLVAFTGGLDMFTAYTQNYMEGMVASSRSGSRRLCWARFLARSCRIPAARSL